MLHFVEPVGAVVLKVARARAGLSQAEVGNRAGVPQSVVSAYERGRREPTMSTLRRLVAATGFDLDLNLQPRTDPGPAFLGPIGRKVQRRRDDVRRLLLERGYRNPQVFGSVARGTDTTDSDLDLLVEPPDRIGLTHLARTAIDLEAMLGVPVDLIPRGGLRPRVADEIAGELVQL